MDIRTYLNTHKLLADGALGTYYAALTESEEMAERANLARPELVKQIHSEYIQAGAKLLRTNTFAANRATLCCSAEEQEQILRAGYRLASEAAEEAEEPIFVAADIGPIPEDIRKDAEDIIAEYREMCDVFLDEGASVFVFETFAGLNMLSEIVPYIKSKSDAFIIVQFSVNRYGYSKTGSSAARLLQEAADLQGVDACGLNCCIGAGHMMQVLDKMELPPDLYITALPNSGYPELHQDRTVYLDNPRYFAERIKEISELGIHILGGCCGTNPGYIRAAYESIDFSPVKKKSGNSVRQEKESGQTVTKNAFYQKLLRGEKVVAVELDPPYDAKTERIMECSHILSAADVDMITFADSPMGRGRVDSILVSAKVKYETNMAVMPHIACRDKNAIALRAGILGGYMNDIRNLLIVTGDPIQGNDVKSVFDFNSIKLMHFISQMNLEHFADDPICFGGALNQGRRNIDGEIRRMEKKIQAGASYFLTQPIFSEEEAERIRYIKSKVDTKILCGIMPLVNYRNAAFIRNEITGIHVPEETVQRFEPDMTREEGEQTGCTIAAEVMSKLDDAADGYYFMLPFNRVHLVEMCLKKLEEMREVYDD